MDNIYKELYELKQRNKEALDNIEDSISSIICIGGPLNDNFLGYTNKQLVIFSRILANLKYTKSLLEDRRD